MPHCIYNIYVHIIDWTWVVFFFLKEKTWWVRVQYMDHWPVILQKNERSGLTHNNNSSEQDQRTGAFRKLASSLKFFKTPGSTVILFCKFSKIWRWAFFDLEKKNPQNWRFQQNQRAAQHWYRLRAFGNREDRRSVPIGVTWLPCCYALKKFGSFKHSFSKSCSIWTPQLISIPFPLK